MCLPIFKGKLEDWQCTSFQILVWIVLWGINNIYCHISALVWAAGLSFLPTFPLFFFFFLITTCICACTAQFPIQMITFWTSHQSWRARKTFPNLVDECHSNQCTESCANIPGSLECFRNPYKFMTQFHCRRGNQPCRSRHPADLRLQLTAMLDGLSIWFIGAEYAH